MMKKILLTIALMIALCGSAFGETILAVEGNRTDRVQDEMQDNWNRLVEGATLPGAYTVTGSLTLSSTLIMADGVAIQCDEIDEATSGAGVKLDDQIKVKDGMILDANSGLTTVWGGAIMVGHPSDVYTYFDDFFEAGYVAGLAIGGTNINTVAKFSETANAGAWLVSITENAADNDEIVAIADGGPGGWLSVETEDANDDTMSLQMNGEAIKLENGKGLYFECKFACEDVDKDNVVMGLSIPDVDFDGGAANDAFVFQMEADGDLDFHAYESGSNYTFDTGVNLTDNANIAEALTNATTCSFYLDGASNLYVWVNGTLITNAVDNGTTVTFADDVSMAPIMEISTTDTGKDLLWVDYIKVIAER